MAALDDILTGRGTAMALHALAGRYHLPPEAVAAALVRVRPWVMADVARLIDRPGGLHELIHWLADPAVARIAHQPAAVIDQGVRVAGDAMHRGLTRGDQSLWQRFDEMARDLAMSHQSLRAMTPALTLIILAAVREASRPAFLRLLHAVRPDDARTDPFSFAAEHAERIAERPLRPGAALRWLDGVLARAHHDAESGRV
ncbi:MAG: hypothetical protein AAFQ35_00860 [Pseudomonadota bacterium]